MTLGADHCPAATRLCYRTEPPRTAPGRRVPVGRKLHCSRPPGAPARLLRESVLGLRRPTTPSDTGARTGQFQRKILANPWPVLAPSAEYAAAPRGSIARARAD